MEKEFLTDKEKERLTRVKSVCNRYKELFFEHPELTNNRILTTIAKEFDLTSEGVRAILIREGEYKKGGEE